MQAHCSAMLPRSIAPESATLPSSSSRRSVVWRPTYRPRRIRRAGGDEMGFWDTASKVWRGISEGRTAAAAHRLAERCLGVQLPPEVAVDGFKNAYRKAEVSSVEEMAMEYIYSYGRYLQTYFDKLSAADKKLAKDRFSKAAQHISQWQSSGARIDHITLVRFLDHARAFGADASPIKGT